MGGAAFIMENLVSFSGRFNAARGFVGGAADDESIINDTIDVSMPHAALWVVQPQRKGWF